MTDETKRQSWGSIEPHETDDFDLVDVYVSYNFAEAELIKDILLDNQIDCFVRKMHPSQFPMDVGSHGDIRVSVEVHQADQAKALLEEAIDEGALSGDGTFNVEG